MLKKKIKILSFWDAVHHAVTLALAQRPTHVAVTVATTMNHEFLEVIILTDKLIAFAEQIVKYPSFSFS